MNEQPRKLVPNWLAADLLVIAAALVILGVWAWLGIFY